MAVMRSKQLAQQIVAADPSQLRSFLAALLRAAELCRSVSARGSSNASGPNLL